MQVSHIREPFGELLAQHSLPDCTTVADAVARVAPNPEGLIVCRVNGGPLYLSRAAWSTQRDAADILEIIEHPAGGDEDIGLAFQFALSVVASIGTGNALPLALFFAGLAVQVSANDPREQQREQPSPTYATGLQGNQARLFQVIPKICGRHQTYPPFASQPYTKIINHEQYLYVILALGIGDHEIERVLIEDTDINHFRDVLTCTYLPPGVAPTQVQGNVINCPEVGGQELLTSVVVGGFVMCGPRVLASRVEFDIVAPFGLGLQDSGGAVGSLSVRFRFDIRPVNEFGSPIGPWSILAMEERTDASRDTRRWTFGYNLATPIRPEVRLTRFDIKGNNARALNDLLWSAARAFLSDPAPLNENVAHFEVVMRASKQLTGVSQNRISVIATGLVPELLPDGTFGDLIPSRNPADWLADLWRSPVWGEGLEDDAIDLATLATLKAVWTARQDRFDYVFDSAMDADSAAQLIAETGRARVFRRGGVRTLTRDQLVTVPRTAFHTRNTVPGSMLHNEELPLDLLPDGVIVEYFDNRSWNFGQPLECPCPGVVNMERPVRIRKAGITGRIHATREGLYEAAKIAYRRESVEATTEMQGSIPPFGSAVRWQSTVTRWVAGDVVEWDEDTLTARLSEPVTYGATPRVITFMADDGRPTEPIQVSPGALSTQVILATDPGIDISTEDGTRERTQYLIGGLGDDDMLVKVARIEDGGGEDGVQLIKLQCYVDDARVHAADNALLPSPGEIQDPIDTSAGEPGEDTLPVVNIEDRNVSTSSPATMTYRFNMDGTAGDTFNPGGSYANLVNQWLFNSPREPSEVAQFEVMFELIDSFDNGNPLNLAGLEYMGGWRDIDQDFVFSATNAGAGTAFIEFNVYIRDKATSLLQDQARISVSVFANDGGGG